MTKLLPPLKFLITFLILELSTLEAGLIKEKKAVELAEVQETERAREQIRQLTGEIEEAEEEGEDREYIVDVVKKEICLFNDPDNCYPLEFEPDTEWKPVRPHQRIPPGLDIRMNLDIGGKEAKLPSGVASVFVKDDNSDNNSNNNDRLLHREKNKENEGETEVNTPQTSQFETQFKIIQTYLEEQEFQEAALAFEELMEYAHDYKYGLIFVTDKFEFIEKISFDSDYPLGLREVATRFILSCLRNNPPVVQYIAANFPNYFDDVLVESLKIDPKDRSYSSSLVGRYISILRELLNKQNNPNALYLETPKLMDDLYRLYPTVSNSGTRLKILEIVSQYMASNLGQSRNQNQNQDQGQEQELPLDTIKFWASELSETIQDPELVDELHVRQLFDALYSIKRRYKCDVKMDSSFMSWLDEQVVVRSEHLNTGASGGSAEDDYLLVGRDPEQDEFDKKLIDSNHNVFGNPMAARIKKFRDEL